MVMGFRRREECYCWGALWIVGVEVVVCVDNRMGYVWIAFAQVVNDLMFNLGEVDLQVRDAAG